MEHQRTSSYSCNFIGGGRGGGAKARSDALRRACVQRWLEIMTVPRVNHRRPQGVFFIMQLVDEGKGAESEKSSITSNREEYSDPEEKTACCVIRSTRVKPLSSDWNVFIVVCTVVCTLCVLLVVERLMEFSANCKLIAALWKIFLFLTIWDRSVTFWWFLINNSINQDDILPYYEFSDLRMELRIFVSCNVLFGFTGSRV